MVRFPLLSPRLKDSLPHRTSCAPAGAAGGEAHAAARPLWTRPPRALKLRRAPSEPPHVHRCIGDGSGVRRGARLARDLPPQRVAVPGLRRPVLGAALRPGTSLVPRISGSLSILQLVSAFLPVRTQWQLLSFFPFHTV